MTGQEFWHSILAINTVNFTVNMENLTINREISARSKERDAVEASLFAKYIGRIERR